MRRMWRELLVSRGGLRSHGIHPFAPDGSKDADGLENRSLLGQKSLYSKPSRVYRIKMKGSKKDNEKWITGPDSASMRGSPPSHNNIDQKDNGARSVWEKTQKIFESNRKSNEQHH